MRPIAVGPNRPDRFYRGGRRIAAFRRLVDTNSPNQPEDWIASTTTLFGQSHQGLSTVGGRLLREWIADEAEAWLGPEHIARFGPEQALLVKLLAPDQRLPIHVHPDRAFARRHLASRWGKTEGWIVLGVAGDRGEVYVGWREPIEPGFLARRVETQDTAGLLRLMHQVSIEVGDAVYIPAGLAHAIGPDVLILELQEPTDFSVLLEWRGFDIDGSQDGHLDLGYDVALQAVEMSALTTARLNELVRPGTASQLPGERVFAPEADAFFRAAILDGSASKSSAAEGYAVVVITDGPGEIETEAGEVTPFERGMTFVVPYAAGRWHLRGGKAICCSPPVGFGPPEA